MGSSPAVASVAFRPLDRSVDLGCARFRHDSMTHSVPAFVSAGSLASVTHLDTELWRVAWKASLTQVKGGGCPVVRGCSQGSRSRVGRSGGHVEPEAHPVWWTAWSLSAGSVAKLDWGGLRTPAVAGTPGSCAGVAGCREPRRNPGSPLRENGGAARHAGRGARVATGSRCIPRGVARGTACPTQRRCAGPTPRRRPSSGYRDRAPSPSRRRRSGRLRNGKATVVEERPPEAAISSGQPASRQPSRDRSLRRR